MTLQLTLATLEGLSADVAAEYVEQEDGSYVLDVAGLPDTGALKRAKDHEKTKRKQAETRIAQLESEIEELRDQVESGGKGLSDQAKARLERRIAELENQLATGNTQLVGEINRLTSQSTADRMAADLSDSPKLLIPIIRARLKTEIEDGRSTIVVLDEDGEESGMSLKDLENEIRNNKEYASIIRGGKGAGSGVPPGKTPGSSQGKKTKLSDYDHKERIALRNENPAEFERLVAESRKGN